MTISDDDARALLHDDEDELFRKLGADLLGQGVGLADEDPERSERSASAGSKPNCPRSAALCAAKRASARSGRR